MSGRSFGCVLVLLATAAITACGTPAGDPERGAALYQRNCVQCHETGGGIGARLTPAGLAAYGTAAGLLEYNRRYMPYNAEGTLTAQEYLDITAYLLREHGFAEPGWELTEATAPGLALTRE